MDATTKMNADSAERNRLPLLFLTEEAPVAQNPSTNSQPPSGAPPTIGHTIDHHEDFLIDREVLHTHNDSNREAEERHNDAEGASSYMTQETMQQQPPPPPPLAAAVAAFIRNNPNPHYRGPFESSGGYYHHQHHL